MAKQSRTWHHKYVRKPKKCSSQGSSSGAKQLADFGPAGYLRLNLGGSHPQRRRDVVSLYEGTICRETWSVSRPTTTQRARVQLATLKPIALSKILNYKARQLTVIVYGLFRSDVVSLFRSEGPTGDRSFHCSSSTRKRTHSSLSKKYSSPSFIQHQTCSCTLLGKKSD